MIDAAGHLEQNVPMRNAINVAPALAEAERSDAEAVATQRVLRWITPGSAEMAVFAVIAVMLGGVSTGIALFAERNLGVDQLGLFNPVYMFLNYGRMTYPVHSYWDSMVVHPPVHYGEIALLMKLGLSLYYAEAVSSLAFTILSLVLIGRGPFPVPVKIGLAFGCVAGTTLLITSDVSPFGLRPDLHLALAWFTGLVLLERGRLRGWDWRELFLGSFVITYASGLHYFGAIAWLGVGVYAVWVTLELGIRRARSSIVALVIGGCLFGIPYLALWAVPNWPGIHQMTSGTQGSGGVWDAIARHMRQYDWSSNAFLGEFRSGQRHSIALVPPLMFHIPTVLISTTVFLLYPTTRGIALASLPLPLFVLLYSQGKSAGYYVPEFMLYLAAFGTVLSTLLQGVARRLTSAKYHWIGLMAAAVILGPGMVWTNPALKRISLSSEPRFHQQEIERAVGREILGPDALVAGRIAVWYTSGATHWINLEGEVLWGQIGDRDMRAYFSQFDAIADSYHMSWHTENERQATLSSWYVDGTLNLRAFYFGHGNPDDSYLLLNVNRPERLVGYGLKQNQLYRFDEQPDGDHLFLSMVCPAAQPRGALGPDGVFFNQLDLPKPSVSAPPQIVLATMIVPKQSYETQGAAASAACTVRDRVPGILSPADAHALRDKLAQTDQTIRFYRTPAEAVAGAKATRGW